jgi:hypothetical protein
MRLVEGACDEQSEKQDHEHLKTQMLHEYLDLVRDLKFPNPAKAPHEVYEPGRAYPGTAPRRW